MGFRSVRMQKLAERQHRRLFLEHLEQRQLLAVTVGLTDSIAGDRVTIVTGPQPGEVAIDVAPVAIKGTASPLYSVFGSETIYQTAGYDQSVQANDFVAVDLTKSYALSGWAKSGDEFGQRFLAGNLQSFGVASFDVDYQPILPEHVYRFASATDTTLAAPLNPGDSVVQLTDASGWSNSALDSAQTRVLAWYGYQDGQGTTYTDYSYTRNVAAGTVDGVWSAGGIVGNTIALNEVWAGPSLPAGTAVRNADASESDAYLVLDSQSVSGDWSWTQYTGVFGGDVEDDGVGDSALFRPGTAYVKPEILANLHGTTENFITWRDVSITQVSDTTIPDDLGLPVIDLSNVTAADQRAPIPFQPGSNHGWTTSIVQVDTSESYTLSALVDAENYFPQEPLQLDTEPLRFASLDVDQKLIHPLHVTKYGNAADTMLAAPLMPGDTSLLLNDATGWSNDYWESAQTRALAWYGYTDSTGHTYDDYTYTRNVAYDFDKGLWKPGGVQYDPAAGAYRVNLRMPWNGPALAAGSAIRNAANGNLYNQFEGNPELLPGTNYLEYAATIGGGLWHEGQSSDSLFRPGTAYIQPVMRSSEVWSDVSIGPAQDVATLGTIYFPETTVEIDTNWQFTFDLDVLSKGLLGGAPTVVIDSVDPAEHGTATIAVGDGGRNIIRYESTPGFVGSDIVSYTLRDTTTSQTAMATAAVTVVDGAERVLMERMREISLAMLNYEGVFRNFPVDASADFDANGNPYLSWRVHILPFLGLRDLYDKFNLDEPWDSVNNLPLLDQMPDVYRSIGDTVDSTDTRFQTFTGSDAPFGRDPVGTVQEGPFGREFTDGLENTILFAQSGANVAVPWTKPDDMAFDVANPMAALGTTDLDTLYVANADGGIYRLLGTIDEAGFGALVTMQGGEIVDLDTFARWFSEQRGMPSSLYDFGMETSLRDIGLAMLNFESATSRFPADTTDAETGELNLSWRVGLLPYLGFQNLYDQFNLDEPWDSPHNLALLSEMPDVFRSMDDSAHSTTTRVRGLIYEPGQDAVGFVTPANLLSGASQRGIRFANYQDGATNTILFVEAGADRAVPWTMPGMLPFEFDDPLATLGDSSSGEFLANMADGQRLVIPVDINPNVFTTLATRTARDLIDGPSLANRNIQRSGELEHTLESVRNAKEISLGVLNFENATRRFPANITRFSGETTPLLSWRVEILPFIGQQGLFSQFRRDEPWDSPHNLKLLQFMPDVFRSLDDPTDSVLTRIVNFRGENAPFSEFAGPGPGFAGIRDGSSNTIAFVEAGEGNAVPWTKPTDTPFHENNPFSALGELGFEFITAMFDGSVHPRSTSISTDQLYAWITNNGGEDVNNPPPITTTEGFYVHETCGDTVTSEFGVDWFDVVLDKAPTSDVVLTLAVDNAAVVILDKPSLTFTPDNWDTPQRVSLTGVDNYGINEDQTVQVTVIGPAPWGTEQFTATILDDDRPEVVGDFNDDQEVNHEDLALWESGYGETGIVAVSDGDANGDRRVDALDFLRWQIGASRHPRSGDFNGDHEVKTNDLQIWENSYGDNNAADANGDGRSDSLDFLAWQRNVDVDRSSDIAGDFNDDGRTDGLDFLKLQREQSAAGSQELQAWESAYLNNFVSTATASAHSMEGEEVASIVLESTMEETHNEQTLIAPPSAPETMTSPLRRDLIDAAMASVRLHSQIDKKNAFGTEEEEPQDAQLFFQQVFIDNSDLLTPRWEKTRNTESTTLETILEPIAEDEDADLLFEALGNE